LADNPISGKLLIKTGYRIAVLNAPSDYAIGELPPGVKRLTRLEAPLDLVQLFVKAVQELENEIPGILAALKKDGLLWICYPKGGSKIKTDLNRDILRQALVKFGLAGVSLISLDQTWSAMRFGPADRVGSQR
jgi:hypothetical protein